MIVRKKVAFSTLISVLLLVVTVTATLPAFAAVAEETSVMHSWTIGAGDMAFKPSSGYLRTIFMPETEAFTNEASSYMSFYLDQSNINAINSYYDETELLPKRFGMDIKNVPNAGATSRFDAYSITTTLPNPVYDKEINHTVGECRNEAEVVATGEIEVGSYSMQVHWYDYRDGTYASPGAFYVNAEISEQWIPGGDYNVYDDTYAHCLSFSYGATPGIP